VKKQERKEINSFLEPFMEEIQILNNRQKWQIEKYGKTNDSLKKKLANLKERILEAKKYAENK
jgi:hypothetical protein